MQDNINNFLIAYISTSESLLVILLCHLYQFHFIFSTKKHFTEMHILYVSYSLDITSKFCTVAILPSKASYTHIHTRIICICGHDLTPHLISRL